MGDAMTKSGNKPEYEWAFKEGILHSVDYDKGFLLKKYKYILA